MILAVIAFYSTDERGVNDRVPTAVSNQDKDAVPCIMQLHDKLVSDSLDSLTD